VGLVGGAYPALLAGYFDANHYWSPCPLFLRCACLNRDDEPQAIEMDSLALSTLWVCIPWFVVDAMAAEEVRRLRPAKRR